jgi:Fe-S-cluster containining protein
MPLNIDQAMKGNAAFECKRCGACCKDRDVPLTLDDIYRLSDFLDMKPDDFFEAHCAEIAMSSDMIALPFLKKDGDTCRFLADNICQVHFVKPSACENIPLFGSLEYLRARMPKSCAIQQSTPVLESNDRKKTRYLTAMMLTTIYYSKHGTFKFDLAKPFIYRILLYRRNRDQIYKLTGSKSFSN